MANQFQILGKSVRISQSGALFAVTFANTSY